MTEPTPLPHPESFADAPKSLDEMDAEASGKASDITPRSCLIEVLRRIDQGVIHPSALIVCYTPTESGRRDIGYSIASPDPILTLGLLARTIHDVQTPPEE